MLQSTHRTKDGMTMLVAQMADSHLLNMIALLVKTAEDARGELDDILLKAAAGQGNGDAWNEVNRQMYGLPKPPDISQATTEFAKGMNQLSAQMEAYVLEAWTRSMDEANYAKFNALSARWAAAVGRNRPLPASGNVVLLAEVAHDDWADYADPPF